jgi:hypothetical protein
VKCPDPWQLSIYDEDDGLTWDQWFVALPVTPTSTSTATPSWTLPATSTHPALTPRKPSERAA